MRWKLKVEVIERPDCAKLGYSQSYRIEDIKTGVYDIDLTNQVEVLGRVYNDADEMLVFDWQADLAMGAVIVKSGQDYNAFVYNPAAYLGIGVESKDQVHGISYADFLF